MIIGYHVWKPHINISIDGEHFLKEDVDITKEEKECAANPLLRKVKEYQNKGWEVMNFDTNSQGGMNADYYAYLRKKK